MSDKKDNLTNHNYDGIQEYDNLLPNWWLMTFFATIIFSFIYWIHYEFGGAPKQLEELKIDLAMIESQSKQNNTKSQTTPVESEEDLKNLITDNNFVSGGREVYQAKCSACHGPELQGTIGPNLVDEYWLHGKGQLTDIITVIRKGVLDKGMPAWETMLKENEIKSVVALIGSQQGSNPPNPKPPQGEKVVRD